MAVRILPRAKFVLSSSKIIQIKALRASDCWFSPRTQSVFPPRSGCCRFALNRVFLTLCGDPVKCKTTNSDSVARAAATRYPIIICDEYQDASADQHAAVMALHRAGSLVRFLGDSMQIIYGGPGKGTRVTLDRWKSLTKLGGFGILSNPHRWRSGSPGLGEWVLYARESLESGNAISLAGNHSRTQIISVACCMLASAGR